jgi:hypothetical protein
MFPNPSSRGHLPLRQHGVPFTYLGASNVWFYSYPTGTNVLALGGTNASGILYPQAVADVPVFPDMNADVNPNVVITVVEGINTNLPVQYPQTAAIGSLQVATIGAYAPFGGTQVVTNTTTYTFAPVSEGGFGFFDQADHVAHAQNAGGRAVGMEDLQGIELLPHSDELHRGIRGILTCRGPLLPPS